MQAYEISYKACT